MAVRDARGGLSFRVWGLIRANILGVFRQCSKGFVHIYAFNPSIFFKQILLLFMSSTCEKAEAPKYW